jgi:hypothetical protein
MAGILSKVEISNKSLWCNSSTDNFLISCGENTPNLTFLLYKHQIYITFGLLSTTGFFMIGKKQKN